MNNSLASFGMNTDSIRKNGTITPRNVTWKPWKERPDKYTGEINYGNYALVHSGHTPFVNKDRQFRKAEVIRLGLKNLKQYRKMFKKIFNHKGEVK